MPRITALELSAAPADSKALLEGVQVKIGMVPNLFKTFAHSPAVLKAYLAQGDALAGGVLPPALREQIALVTAGTNQCDYCASAHTLMGKSAGVDAKEATANLRGLASDAKIGAALSFAKTIVEHRGRVTDGQLSAVRAAGYSEAEIVEIVAHVAMNLFTNYFNHIADTVIDFPLISTATKKAA